MKGFVAGAFDAFGDANAAAEEMRGCGFVESEVRLTSNPANPDGTPGGSLVDEASAIPGILERFFSSLIDFSGQRCTSRHRTEEIRRGGVVVSVPVASHDERSIARAILYRRRAVELGNVAGGIPIY